MPQDHSIAILHPRDALLTTYTKVAQQLFSEVDISGEELWIGRVVGAPLVRIFFAGIAASLRTRAVPGYQVLQGSRLLGAQSRLQWRHPLHSVSEGEASVRPFDPVELK